MALRKRILYLYIFFAIFIYEIIFSVSRGTLLIIILGILYFYNRKHQFRWKTVMLFFGIILLFLSLAGLVRLKVSSMVFSNFGDSPLQIFLSSIYTYFAYNFNNLNQLINSNVEMSGFWYSLKAFLTPFYKHAYDTNSIGLHNYDTLFFNARTYLYPFYSDLHVIGTILYPFILGVIISLIVRVSNRNSMYILLLMFMQKAIFMTTFGNYFFSELVILFPYIFFIFIVLFRKFVISRKANKENIYA